ncbi:MAG: DUF3575 domain-containing protein [Bacteroidales bacterium]|nr:DUF3575 domain-containing protein [Bacteroidales bacterium]
MTFNRHRQWLLLIFLLLGAGIGHSQERRSEFHVDFRVNSMTIDTMYADNGLHIGELAAFLKDVQEDGQTEFVGVSFCGAASPEGGSQWNRRLAKGRMESLERIVRDLADIPDSLITHSDSYISWDYLYQLVSRAEISHKEEILEIIDSDPADVGNHTDSVDDYRIFRLKTLAGGTVWPELIRRFFGPMRNASAVFVTFRQLPPVPEPEPEPSVTEEPAPMVMEEETEQPAQADTLSPQEWVRRLYIKTNAVYWALGITNIGLEVDICRHLSFNIPVMYSAWNYFTYGVKFRTLAFSPELRYWFSTDDRACDSRLCNDGWFLGAHFGMGWYNVGANGDWRIQDHNGKTPALGGGLDAGYRMPISKNGRWQVEFSLGVGVYKLKYDRFHNYDNGLMTSTVEKIYFGPDQAAVSFSYSFDLKRKGGAK